MTHFHPWQPLWLCSVPTGWALTLVAFFPTYSLEGISLFYLPDVPNKGEETTELSRLGLQCFTGQNAIQNSGFVPKQQRVMFLGSPELGLLVQTRRSYLSSVACWEQRHAWPGTQEYSLYMSSEEPCAWRAFSDPNPSRP